MANQVYRTLSSSDSKISEIRYNAEEKLLDLSLQNTENKKNDATIHVHVCLAKIAHFT